MANIKKIVLTGGPCAGKTTVLEYINNYYSKLGVKVLVVPEVATELINSGIAPWTCKTSYEFQKIRIKQQVEREKEIYLKALEQKNTNILIVYDRGLMDTKAYLNDEEFMNLLDEVNLDLIDARDHYDMVFHLVTVAKEQKKFYTLSNNSARIETIEEASMLDDKIISSWIAHPYYKIIPATESIDDKINKIIDEINNMLFSNQHYEIERKYLIKYPDIELLDKYPTCDKVYITQTYIYNDETNEVRLRKRGNGYKSIYFKTIKNNISGIKREEKEKRIAEEEYNEILNQFHKKTEIIKTRYCLLYNNTYYEIDIYPFWEDKAILEVELNDEGQDVVIPEFLKVIKEVTNDCNYKNQFLSKKYNNL